MPFSRCLWRQLLALGCLLPVVLFGVVWASFSPLQRINSSELDLVDGSDILGLDRQIWGDAGEPGDRRSLLIAIDYSLAYLQTPKAANVYQNYAIAGITRDRVRHSLARFRQVVISSNSPAQLQAAIKREFVFYKAAGKDGKGTVGFTGYFEPIYAASRERMGAYRYPLYRLPPDLASWPKPHPTRLELEGADGLSAKRLRGLELVWLRDRFQAFLVHVQGSARLKLTDGSVMTVGYASKTDRAYTGVGRELVRDGKFTLEELTLIRLTQYFKQFPADMNKYLPRNESFVFFRETNGAPPTGSLGVPVTEERSIATDKSLMPPGALALIKTRLPYQNQKGNFEQFTVSKYVLDQDSGAAIKGAGRVDIFMGTGDLAGDRAGLINATGELYYLILK
jgi:membrane-bound lytic murein transglycosylase A